MAATRVVQHGSDEGHKSNEIDKMSTVITQLLGNDESSVKRRQIKIHARKKVKHVQLNGVKAYMKRATSVDGQIPTQKVTNSSAVTKCHFVPDSSMLMYEKRLKRLATRGVVQLFNGVNKQQKELEAKLSSAGSSETKKRKIMKSVDKRKFLDMLKETDEANVSTDVKRKKKDTSVPDVDQPTWSVLRDNYTYKNALQEEIVH